MDVDRSAIGKCTLLVLVILTSLFVMLLCNSSCKQIVRMSMCPLIVLLSVLYHAL